MYINIKCIAFNEIQYVASYNADKYQIAKVSRSFDILDMLHITEKDTGFVVAKYWAYDYQYTTDDQPLTEKEDKVFA